jgi:hypothetical protein
VRQAVNVAAARGAPHRRRKRQTAEDHFRSAAGARR